VTISGLALRHPKPARLRTMLHPPREVDAGQVRIRYELARPAHRVALAVYDVAGHRLWQIERAARAAGEHFETWDRMDARRRHVTRGTYIVRLQTDAVTLTRKLVLVHR
jgi:hypothetical protein